MKRDLLRSTQRTNRSRRSQSGASGTGVSSAWDAASTELEQVAGEAASETLGGAVEMVMRAAAVDTGAIEGLYDVNEGITLTVATQAAAWQESLNEAGANVRALFEAQLSAYQNWCSTRRPRHVRSLKPLSVSFTRLFASRRRSTSSTQQSGHRSGRCRRGEYKTDPNHVLLPDEVDVRATRR